MDKKSVIEYLKNNKSELFDICKELNLRLPYENREELLSFYHNLIKCRDYYAGKSDEKSIKAYSNLQCQVEEFENTYHILDPNFNEEVENLYIPENYNDNAFDIFNFRKGIFRTSNIYLDKQLNDIIHADMKYIWKERGGQMGMYQSFPCVFSRRSIERDVEDYDNCLETIIRCKTEIIRSYALSGNGGIAIIETRLYTHYNDLSKIVPKYQDSYSSRQQVVTLGEDDAFHFLHSSRIYEECYGGRNKDFIELLNLALKEYKEQTKIGSENEYT